ncbi:MAG: hypothetical protein ABIF11_02975, partial [Nitrospirota bacterium]
NVRKLWKATLLNDNDWHYTLEHTYIDLRINKKSVPKVEKYLNSENIPFKNKGPYVDPNETVSRYQKQMFEKLFHVYCMFALNVDILSITGEYTLCLERILHMFANANAIPLYVEAQAVNQAAFDRIFSSGYIEGQHSVWKTVKDKLKNKEE